MPSIISVENLSKAYRIGVADEKHDTLAATVASWVKAPFRNLKRLASLNTSSSLPAPLPSPLAPSSPPPAPGSSLPTPGSPPPASDIHWALRDVSFEVNEGEVVGIIGRNGAGKSTLLKILSRITDPTSGRAVIRGRVSSLLEVGTGFHPELSGRDNIYMNGTILGMRKKEIDRKFDEIVEFSGIEKFIDTPIKRYSSGMKVRLAFSVAAHLEPEILIIDEVLAVGDFEFQNKCLGKMQDVSSHGRTVLFVSHNMAAVQALCSRCVLLNQGTVLAVGDTADIIRRFTSLGYDPNTAGGIFQRVDFPEVRPPFYLTRAKISRRHSEQPQTEFECDDSIQITIDYFSSRTIAGLYGYLTLSRPDGTIVYEGDSHDAEFNCLDGLKPGAGTFTVSLPPRTLGVGRYLVCVNFNSPTDRDGPNIDLAGVVGDFLLVDGSTRRGNRRNGYFSSRFQWQVCQDLEKDSGINSAVHPPGHVGIGS